MRIAIVSLLCLFVASGCCRTGSDSTDGPAPESKTSPSSTKPAATTTPTVTSTTTAAPEKPSPSAKPAGDAPIADGKYEHVTVEGKSVAMIQVSNNGDTVLVDDDGAKPRTWEHEYKRKGDVPAGTYNLHKTDVNKNNSFEDDPVDKQGKWQIDSKGNIK